MDKKIENKFAYGILREKNKASDIFNQKEFQNN
jgi:hypothetical protein